MGLGILLFHVFRDYCFISWFDSFFLFLRENYLLFGLINGAKVCFVYFLVWSIVKETW